MTSAAEPPPFDPLPTTDLANALRLDRRYGSRFRHNAAMGWSYWDGQLWRPDDTDAQIKSVIQGLQRLVGEEAAEAQKLGLDQHAKALLSYIRRAQAKVTMSNALALWQPRVFQAAGDFDQQTGVVTVDGGVLDLERRKVGDYDPSMLCTRRMPVSYREDAECPWFTATLEYFVPDQQVREYLQRWAGYCLTNDIGEQQFSIWYGKGANGKSTVLEAIRQVLGSEADRGFALEADTRVFEPRQPGSGQNADPDRVRMRGMKLVTAIESEAGFHLDSSFVKAVTGGEAMTARDLYRSSMTFKPSFKIVFVSNHEPVITDDSEGMWRRVHKVDWAVRIPDEYKLPWEVTVEKLRSERSGILNWCLDGYDEWLRHGLAAPPQVTLASTEMRLAQDKYGLFLRECTIPDPDGTVARPVLWAAYCEWRKGDKKLVGIGRNQFYREMEDRLGALDGYRRFQCIRVTEPYWTLGT